MSLVVVRPMNGTGEWIRMASLMHIVKYGNSFISSLRTIKTIIKNKMVVECLKGIGDRIPRAEYVWLLWCTSSSMATPYHPWEQLRNMVKDKMVVVRFNGTGDRIRMASLMYTVKYGDSFISSLTTIKQKKTCRPCHLLLRSYLWLARTLTGTTEMMVSVVNICSRLTYYPLSIIFAIIMARGW